jgi:hypothetical protein
MSSNDIAVLATQRAGIVSADTADCVRAVSELNLSGRTFKKDWQQNTLLVSFAQSAYFQSQSAHRDKVIEALVAIRAEAESAATGSGGCIAGRDTYGIVVHVGDIRDGIQRNVLVANVQTGAYSLYPASALLPCSSSLIISSESERDSLVSELIRLYPTIGEFGVHSGTIKGLIEQYGSKFW